MVELTTSFAVRQRPPFNGLLCKRRLMDAVGVDGDVGGGLAAVA